MKNDPVALRDKLGQLARMAGRGRIPWEEYVKVEREIEGLEAARVDEKTGELRRKIEEVVTKKAGGA